MPSHVPTPQVGWQVTIAAPHPTGMLGCVFGGGEDGRPVVRRLEPVPGVAATAASRGGLGRPGALLLAVGRARVAGPHLAPPGPGAGGGPSPAADAGSSASPAAALAVGPEQCARLLREAPHPETGVLFRDMGRFLATRQLASAP